MPVYKVELIDGTKFETFKKSRVVLDEELSKLDIVVKSVRIINTPHISPNKVDSQVFYELNFEYESRGRFKLK